MKSISVVVPLLLLLAGLQLDADAQCASDYPAFQDGPNAFSCSNEFAGPFQIENSTMTRSAVYLYISTITGNVGISTGVPQAPLHVRGGSGTSSPTVLLENPTPVSGFAAPLELLSPTGPGIGFSTGTSAGPRLLSYIAEDSDGSGLVMGPGVNATPATQSPILYVGLSGTNYGNVGIQTTSPAAPLSVLGQNVLGAVAEFQGPGGTSSNPSNPGVLFRSTTTGDTSPFQLVFSSSPNDSLVPTYGGSQIKWDPRVPALQLGGFPSAPIYVYIRQDTGFVGIGTSIPGAPLDVEQENSSGYSVNLSSGLEAPSGTISAAHFIGDGSGLTGIGGGSVYVGEPITGNGTSGSPLGVDSSSATLQGNQFNGANELVQLSASGKLPASVFNGSAALLASTQVFTAGNTFQSWSVFSGSVTATNPNNTFEGNGAALANLNAGAIGGLLGDAGSESVTISTGVTLDAAALTYASKIPASDIAFSGVAALLPSTQSFTGSDTFFNPATFNSSVTVNSLGATGNISAPNFVGGGGLLTNLTAGNIAANGTFLAENAEALTDLNPGALTNGTVGSVLTFASSQTFASPNTSLPAVEVSSGLVVAAGLVGIGTTNPHAPLAVDEVGALGYSMYLSSGLNMPNGTINAAHFIGDGSELSGLLGSISVTEPITGNGTSGSKLGVDSSSVTLQGNQFNGANELAQLNASGKLPASVFSGSAALLASTQSFTGQNTFVNMVTVSSSIFVAVGTNVSTITPTGIQAEAFAGDGSALTNLTAGNLAANGTFLAENGSALTSLTAGNLASSGTFPAENASALTNLDAANLSSGLVPDARLDSSSVTLQANTFNGPNELVQLNGSGKLPTSVLSGSAALLASTQAFTGQNAFTNMVTVSSSIFVALGANVSTITPTGIQAEAFAGDGSALTNLTAGNIAANGTFLAENGSALTSLTAGNLTANGTFPAENGAALTNLTAGNIASGGTFLAENGSALTSLNAANLSSGLVPDARLDSSSVTLQANTFNGPNELVQLNAGGKLPASVYSGSAALLASTQSFTGQNTFVNMVMVSSSIFVALGANASTITPTGIQAEAFAGGGSALTNLTAGNITANGTFLAENGSALTNLNASQLASGTVPDNRLDNSSVTLQGNQFNGVNELVQLNGNGKLPTSVFSGSAALLASTQVFTGGNTFQSWSVFSGSITATNPNNTFGGNGSALTNLTGTNVTGEVPSGVLPSTVAFLSSTATFTAPQAFYDSATFTAGGASTYSAGFSSGVVVGPGQGSATTTIVGSTVTASNFYGNGSGLSNVTAAAIAAENVTPGTFGAEVYLPAAQLTDTASAGNLPATVLYSTIPASINASDTFIASQTFESLTGFANTGANAFSIQTSSGVDVTAGELLVGSGAAISTITPTGFFGNGSGLTGLSAGSIVAGTLGVANGGTGATTASGARADLSAAASGANSDITSLSDLTGAVTFGSGSSITAANGQPGVVESTSVFVGVAGSANVSTITPTGFFGNGSGLMSLNGSAVNGGIVGTNFLPNTVAYTNSVNTFMSSQTITGTNVAGGYSLYLSSGLNTPEGTVTAGYFSGNGAGLTNLIGTTQWTTAGANIYYILGNVGVGTSVVGSTLTVNGAAQFGSGPNVSTFSASGNLQMPAGSTITTNGGTLTISTSSAIGASSVQTIFVSTSGTALSGTSDFLGGVIGAGWQNYQKFTTTGSNTFQVLSGVYKIMIWLIGGGGGGGGGTVEGAGGGGGGGGCFDVYITNVLPGQSVTIDIGAGGSGGKDATGTSGGATTSLTETAGGGGAGSGAGNSSAGSGGTCSGNGLFFTGNAGGVGGTFGASGGASGKGTGGGAGTGGASPPNAPANGGGGGGGNSSSSFTAGSGGSGIAIVWW